MSEVAAAPPLGGSTADTAAGQQPSTPAKLTGSGDERQHSPAERVPVLPFPAPLPAPLLAGFEGLARLDGLSPWRPSRFVAALARARASVQRLAALPLSFAPEEDAWKALMSKLPEATRRRLTTPLSFQEAATFWRIGACLTAAKALKELLDVWDAESERLPEIPRRRNHLRTHRVRHPHLWQDR